MISLQSNKEAHAFIERMMKPMRLIGLIFLLCFVGMCIPGKFYPQTAALDTKLIVESVFSISFGLMIFFSMRYVYFRNNQKIGSTVIIGGLLAAGSIGAGLLQLVEILLAHL